MPKDYHDAYIEEKFNNLNEKLQLLWDNHEKFLRKILEQTKKTNWRVTKLEEETRIARWFTRNPKALILGIMFVSSVYISDIRKPFFEAVKKVLWF